MKKKMFVVQSLTLIEGLSAERKNFYKTKMKLCCKIAGESNRDILHYVFSDTK